MSLKRGETMNDRLTNTEDMLIHKMILHQINQASSLNSSREN